MSSLPRETHRHRLDNLNARRPPPPPRSTLRMCITLYEGIHITYVHIFMHKNWETQKIKGLTTRPTSATTLSINCKLTSSPGWPRTRTCKKSTIMTIVSSHEQRLSLQKINSFGKIYWSPQSYLSFIVRSLILLWQLIHIKTITWISTVQPPLGVKFQLAMI